MVAVSMSTNLLVPQARDAKICGASAGSLPGEWALQSPGETELFVSLWGAFSSAAMSPSAAWKSLGSAETPGSLPPWTMISSSTKPQGLGWPSEPASPADCFLRPHGAPGEERVIQSQLRGKQPSFQSPSHSVASSIYCLDWPQTLCVWGGGEEDRLIMQNPMLWRKPGRTTAPGKIPWKVCTVAVPRNAQNLTLNSAAVWGQYGTVL